MKDLHTVDNGVIDHLIPAMRAKFGMLKDNLQPPNLVDGGWDVLIGHMLGVDHVGHRHGPDHPAMSSKLVQVDGVIREIIDILRSGKDTSDTILFIMVFLFYFIFFFFFWKNRLKIFINFYA